MNEELTDEEVAELYPDGAEIIIRIDGDDLSVTGNADDRTTAALLVNVLARHTAVNGFISREDFLEMVGIAYDQALEDVKEKLDG